MIREREVRALVAAFGVHVREHYRAAGGDVGRDRVLEVLNAIAITTATVLAGTGGDRQALDFFADALAQQLASLLAELANPAEGDPLH
jgi:hypothetical protein